MTKVSQINPNKPVVQMRDAFIADPTGSFFGVVIDYPEDHQAFPGAVSNGETVRTSAIEKTFSEGGFTYVETQRTTYKILSFVEA